MTDPEQQHITLPAAVMACIKAITGDESIPPPSRLSGVLLLIFGYAWYERQDTIDPRSIALPSEQWREVCGMLTNGVGSDPLSDVNLGLSFMNSGPSAYEEN
jgi:hypothetical protein